MSELIALSVNATAAHSSGFTSSPTQTRSTTSITLDVSSAALLVTPARVDHMQHRSAVAPIFTGSTHAAAAVSHALQAAHKKAILIESFTTSGSSSRPVDTSHILTLNAMKQQGWNETILNDSGGIAQNSKIKTKAIVGVHRQEERVARVGSVFGSGGDLNAFQSLIKKQRGEETSDEDTPDINSEQEEMDVESAETADIIRQRARDKRARRTEQRRLCRQAEEALEASTEEEWESRIGMRSGMAQSYDKPCYKTIEEVAVDDWERAATTSNSNQMQLAIGGTAAVTAAAASVPQSPQITSPRSNSPSRSQAGLSPRGITRPPRLPPVTALPSRKPEIKLHRLDVERSVQPSAGPLSPPKLAASVPTNLAATVAPPTFMRQDQVNEIERNTLHHLPLPVPRVSKHHAAKTEEEKTSTTEIPSFGSPIKPLQQLRPSASTPVISSPPPASSEMLTPRTRYNQLSSACAHLLPSTPLQHAAMIDRELHTANITSPSSSSTPFSHVFSQSDLTGALYETHTGRQLMSNRKNQSGSGTQVIQIRPGSPSSRPGTSGGARSRSDSISIAIPGILGSPRDGFPSSPNVSQPGTANNSRPGTSGGGSLVGIVGRIRGISAARTRKVPRLTSSQLAQSRSVKGTAMMNTLLKRKKLSSEFLSEIEYALGEEARDGHTAPISTHHGLSLLSVEENLRVAHHKNALVLMTAGSASSSSKTELSSAAVMAVKDVHGLSLSSGSYAHGPPPKKPFSSLSIGELDSVPRPHTKNNSIRQEFLQAKLKGPVDPAMGILTKLALSEGIALTSTMDPSPVVSASHLNPGHKYMVSHAMHHHLPLPDPPVMISGGRPLSPGKALVKNTQQQPIGAGASMHLVEAYGFQPASVLAHSADTGDQEPPLPSSSSLLQQSSPSSQPAWEPPSFACARVSESIYYHTKSLKGLISSGVGQEALKAHLLQIRPPLVAEAARKKALAEKAIANIQQYAKDHKTNAIKARAEASKLAQERREIDRKMKEIARKEKEEQREQVLAARHAVDAISPLLADTIPHSHSSIVSAFTSPIASLPGSPLQSKRSSSLWGKVKSLTIEAKQAAISQAEAAAAQKKARMDARHAERSKRDAEAAANRLAPPPVKQPVYYSLNRTPKEHRGSNFGPCGEDLAMSALMLIPPSTPQVANMLDASIAASEDVQTSDEKKLFDLICYNNVLARLYSPITPQERRMKRLDQPKVTAEDLHRVVMESCGTNKTTAKKRFA